MSIPTKKFNSPYAHVRDSDKAGKIRAVNVLFQRRPQGEMDQGIVWERFQCGEEAVAIHENKEIFEFD